MHWPSGGTAWVSRSSSTTYSPATGRPCSTPKPIRCSQFFSATPAPPGPRARESIAGPAPGFFLVSLNRDVESTLGRLADLGFAHGVRQIVVPAPHGKQIQMAVITAPDGVRVELIGPAR